MTVVIVLSRAGMGWLAAGAVLWWIFVALGLRFELRRSVGCGSRTDDASDPGLSAAVRAMQI